jgi:Na+/H+-dicarboxylate symporter
MKKLFRTSFIYLILGAFAGIFFREFTKLNNYHDFTMLSIVHAHLLILGFIFFLILTLTYPILKLDNNKQFNKWFIFYNIGLFLTTSTMFLRGICQVKGFDIVGLNHLAGTGHALLGISLFWFMLILKKNLHDYALTS